MTKSRSPGHLRFPPSLSPASESVTMTSEFKYFAFGDDGLDHPHLSGFPFDQEFPGISDQFLESSKILADVLPIVDEAMSPLSMLDNQVSESFGMQETQFPPFNLSTSPQIPIAHGAFPTFDSSFDLAPSSPMQSRLTFEAYPESPFPFSGGVSSESSVDHSDSESLTAVHEHSMESSVPADRSYFKVDLEFPWQVYIRDPERLEKVTAWKKKKLQVLQEHKTKKNTYQVRTDVANRRMRIKGRFVGKCIS